MNIGDVLLERKLLLIGNFILTSGKSSPYYLDLRRFPSFPEFFDVVEEAKKVVEKVEFDMIIGIATGGVPLASFLACKLRKPMGYIRLEKKGYGTDKLLEAEVEGKRVLVVDDVATTGGSLERAIKEVNKNGGKVVGAFVLVDRREGAREKLKEMGVELYSLYNIHDILRSILGKLTEAERKGIEEYLVKNVE